MTYMTLVIQTDIKIIKYHIFEANTKTFLTHQVKLYVLLIVNKKR